MLPRRLFHTPLPLRTFLRNSHSGSSWLHLPRMMFSALRVLDKSLRYFLMRLCRRPHTASQLMMPPHNYRSRSSSSGASYPTTLYLDCQALPSAHCNAGSASPPQPPDIATLCSPSSASCASDCHAGTTAPRVSPQPPPGLEKYAHSCTSRGIPVKAAPVRPRLCTSISVTPLQPCKHHPTGNTSCALSYYVQEKCKYRPAGTHNPVGADPRAGSGPFPYTGNTDLAFLLNKDSFEPDPIVLTFKADSTSKGTWGMVLLIVRGLLRRPSLSGTPTVTFAQYTFTMSLLRNVTHPLSYFSGCTGS